MGVHFLLSLNCGTAGHYGPFHHFVYLFLLSRCSGAMREIGYVEDSSASCLPDCQGTFKLQHDTSQNLKYFYVFPKVANIKSNSDSATSSSSSAEPVPSLDTKSKDYLVVAADMSTFQEMVQRKVISWHQKKKLQELLKEKSDEFKLLEEKLMRGELLLPIENEIYEANSGCDVDKIAWLQGEIKAMVEKGELTADEKKEALRYLDKSRV